MLERGAAVREPCDPASASRRVETAVSVRLLDRQARFSLRLGPDYVGEVGSSPRAGLALPVNRGLVERGCSVARLGPNEWLVCAPEEDAVAQEMTAAFAGQGHALVDIGHRDVAFEVSGTDASQVLSVGCSLDLSETAFPVGSATRTLLGKADVVLMRLHDEPIYRVECLRSFQNYVHAFLLEAALEFRISDR